MLRNLQIINEKGEVFLKVYFQKCKIYFKIKNVYTKVHVLK